MKVLVGIDSEGYSSKPDKSLMRGIKVRCSKPENYRCVEISELAYIVGSQGHSFVPAYLMDGVKAENFKEIQVFTLDFDGGITFATVKERAEKVGLKIAIAYKTFSYTYAMEKFRVLFVLDNVIKDTFVARVIFHMLHTIFPECDPSCKNLDRTFYGGKGIIYLDESARVELVQLTFSLYSVLDNNGNYKRNLENFSKKSDVAIENGTLAIGYKCFFDEKTDTSMYNIIEISGNSSIFIKRRNNSGMHQKHTCIPKQKIDVKNKQRCMLLNDFMVGKHMNHLQKFAIILNLFQIVKGKELFLDVLKSYYDGDTVDKWERDIKYLKGYRPCKCSEQFCPYYEQCNSNGTIVSTIINSKEIYYNGTQKYYSLEEAQACFKNNFQMACESRQEGIHLIKSQTAMGKTHTIVEYIVTHPEERFLIAEPTNMLKEELVENLKIKGINAYSTVSITDNMLIPKEIREDIQNNHSKGVHNTGKMLIKEYRKSIEDDGNKLAVIKECDKYISGDSDFLEERVVVTTHAFLLWINENVLNKFTVIIDEDIVYMQFLSKINTVSEVCLNNIIENYVAPFDEIAKKILEQQEDKYCKADWKTFNRYLSLEEMDDLGCGEADNINDLGQATAFMREKDTGIVHYFTPNYLKKKKYIVLSATADEIVYRDYFKGVMDVYTYKECKAKYKGNLFQYTYHSLGRRDLKGKLDIFDIVKKISGNDGIPIITFKCMGKINDYDLHFGNAIGVNSLKGKDIAIIGTPYKHELTYKLIACHLYNEYVCLEKLCKRRVEYKGYEFCFMSYANEQLRRIEMYSMESEMEQCVGRARLLRENCNVYLFSSFPCEQAQINISDYL